MTLFYHFVPLSCRSKDLFQPLLSPGHLSASASRESDASHAPMLGAR